MKLIVGFSRSNSKLAFLSPLIRKVEGTEYSHTYIKYEKNGVWWIYEASLFGVRIRSAIEFESENTVVFEYATELSEQEATALFKSIAENKTFKYGILQLVGIALKIIFRLKKNPFDDNDETYVCSELVAYTTQDAINQQYDMDFDLITPKNVQNTLKNTPRFYQINNYL